MKSKGYCMQMFKSMTNILTALFILSLQTPKQNIISKNFSFFTCDLWSVFYSGMFYQPHRDVTWYTHLMVQQETSCLPQIWIRRNAFWNIVQSSLNSSLSWMSTFRSTSREHSFLKLEMHSSIRPAYAPKNSCNVDKNGLNHNFVNILKHKLIHCHLHMSSKFVPSDMLGHQNNTTGLKMQTKCKKHHL